uniref:Polycomb group RING finger protein 2 n=1 Tax=Ascaris suum TaxID=6253 RepID=F1KYK1_ASCSU
MKAADFNENLCCSLCKSYLIDAVTLSECLHSFCRSCLLAHLCHESRCPKCACDLGPELSEAFVRDDPLQRIVYKMVPDVYWEEMRRRGEFYKRRTISNEEKAIMFEKNLLQLSSELCASNEMVSLCIEYVSPGPSEADEATNTIDGDEMRPTTIAEADRVEKMVTWFKRYFRCIAATTMGALRKLMEAKLEVCDTYRLLFVDPECNSTLDDCCTLQDVAYMFSWRRDSPMRILFTLQRHLEEEKPPVLDMELMPELVAEEPLPQTSVAMSSALDTPVQLPALTVSLNTSMMEGGPNHQPIITTGLQPPPRKKRKPSSPTKKQQPASPAPPIQRMIGISPLAKGPPPLVRQDKAEGAAQAKKSTSSATSNGPVSPNKKVTSSEKPVVGSPSKPVFDGPTAAKQPKLTPTSCFDSKMQKIISSTTTSSSKSSSDSPISSCSNSNSATNSQSVAADTNSNGSTSSCNKTQTSTDSAQSTNTTNSQTSTNTTKPTSSNNSHNSQSSQSSQANTSGSQPNTNNSHASRSSPGCNSGFSAVSSLGSNSPTTIHPRPIQPRPVEAKTNYEALVKGYTLNGVNKFAAFALDGKQAKSFAAHAMHVQSSIFLDPKLAAQPIKQVLSGRGMPLMPEAAPYLRPPSAQLASFMQHLHMQSFQGTLSSASSPILHSNGSASPSTPPIPSHLSVSQGPPTQVAQLKLPTVSAGSADSSKLLGKTSPVPKIQQKIGASLPIPTAHITPFMSQS